MGNVWVTGKGALAWLQGITTNDVSRLDIGGVQYSALATPEGTVVDDILVSRVDAERYMVVINAGNIPKDLAWLKAHASPNVDLHDASTELGILSLQGPFAAAILQKITPAPLSQLGTYQCQMATVAGIEMLISRTGYTGEDGFELFPKSDDCVKVWSALFEVGKPMGLLPVGLGARDTLRLEAGYSLYGHEITDQTNLLEAGLGWIVSLDKGDFIGRDALVKIKAEGLKRKLVGLTMDELAIPREGFAIEAEGKSIGFITSGTLSPTLNKGIGMAYVTTAESDNGRRVEVVIRDARKAAVVGTRRFYNRSKV